ncbi:MAG: acyl-CoA dehydrogenase [Rhizobacter sp.]|nr:acyl-CoA dehydrogenase [Rhizobacter sp.]
MNFESNDEQQQLQDSLRRLLGDTYGFERRRAIVASAEGWSLPTWRQLAELGVTGLAIPESHGGFGGGMTDLLPVMEEFGRALLLEPFLASCVLGATALVRSGDESMCRELLPMVANGERRLAFAHDEAGAQHAALWVETTARQAATGWRLDGRKVNMLHGSLAHQAIVSARIGGAPGDADGLALFMVDPAAPGVTLRAHRLVDDSLAAELTLVQAAATPLGDPLTSAAAAVRATVNAGIATTCAEAVGAMQAAYDLAVTYLNTRQQFGRVIGSNQALRHRAAEMLVSLETARSAAIAAAVAIDDPDTPDAALDLSRAKMMIGRHGRFVAQQAIQLHGGIGMTEEYAVGHYLRRLTVIDQLFGDGDAHAARLGRKLMQPPEAVASVASVAA